jgi:hypothetical protein
MVRVTNQHVIIGGCVLIVAAGHVTKVQRMISSCRGREVKCGTNTSTMGSRVALLDLRSQKYPCRTLLARGCKYLLTRYILSKCTPEANTRWQALRTVSRLEGLHSENVLPENQIGARARRDIERTSWKESKKARGSNGRPSMQSQTAETYFGWRIDHDGIAWKFQVVTEFGMWTSQCSDSSNMVTSA